MIFLAPKKNNNLVVERGIFVSTEMGRAFSGLKFSEKFFPVHTPFKGLIKLDYGGDDHNRIDRKSWDSHHLPTLYGGEDLTGKKLVVFPMHALGDQLYLAIVLRGLQKMYPGFQVTIVSSLIPSTEKWYPYIYFEPFCQMTQAVVNVDDMKQYDYFVDAEHFAHKDEFQGTNATDFFMSCLFHHDSATLDDKTPKIAPVTLGDSSNSVEIEKALNSLKEEGKPVVLVNLLSTGRTRDLPFKAVLDFAEIVKDNYSLIFSTYNNPDFEELIKKMNSETMLTSGILEKDVSDLIEIIMRVDMVITTDSGITHLSEALKTPCGSVFNVAFPEERTLYYEYSECLQVEFEIPGVCKTPCYVFALDKDELCPGMKSVNKYGDVHYYDYPPCLENLSGQNLSQLLDALAIKFDLKPE